MTRQGRFAVITIDLRPFMEAMEEAARKLTETLKGLKLCQPPAGPPPPHVFFIGDFDLRCRVRGCGKGPEEH